MIPAFELQLWVPKDCDLSATVFPSSRGSPGLTTARSYFFGAAGASRGGTSDEEASRRPFSRCAVGVPCLCARVRPNRARTVPGLLRYGSSDSRPGRYPGGDRSRSGVPTDGRCPDRGDRSYRYHGFRGAQSSAFAATRRNGGGRADPSRRPGDRHRYHRPGRGGSARADRGRRQRARKPPGRDRCAASGAGG